jgi:hypothetical protein
MRGQPGVWKKLDEPLASFDEKEDAYAYAKALTKSREKRPCR